MKIALFGDKCDDGNDVIAIILYNYSASLLNIRKRCAGKCDYRINACTAAYFLLSDINALVFKSLSFVHEVYAN